VNWNSRGLWYSLVGNGTIVRLEYQLWSEANGFSQLSIFTGSCGEGQLVCFANAQGEADDSYMNNFNALVVHEFLAEFGETYRILLTGELFDTAADYEFKVSEYEVPVNDRCEGAIAVDPSPNLPVLIKEDNRGATPDFTELTVETCGVNWNSRGLWYSLVGNGANVRLEYQLWSKANGLSQLSIFTGSCGEGELVCFANAQGAADDSYSPDFNALVVHEFLAEEGIEYMILLTGEHFNTAADYEFKVSVI